MKASILSVIAVMLLSACSGMKPVKYAANQVCGAGEERQKELAERIDRATHPHKVRVHCDVQE